MRWIECLKDNGYKDWVIGETHHCYYREKSVGPIASTRHALICDTELQKDWTPGVSIGQNKCLIEWEFVLVIWRIIVLLILMLKVLSIHQQKLPWPILQPWLITNYWNYAGDMRKGTYWSHPGFFQPYSRMPGESYPHVDHYPERGSSGERGSSKLSWILPWSCSRLEGLRGSRVGDSGEAGVVPATAVIHGLVQVGVHHGERSW